MRTGSWKIAQVETSRRHVTHGVCYRVRQRAQESKVVKASAANRGPRGDERLDTVTLKTRPSRSERYVRWKRDVMKLDRSRTARVCDEWQEPWHKHRDFQLWGLAAAFRRITCNAMSPIVFADRGWGNLGRK